MEVFYSHPIRGELCLREELCTHTTKRDVVPIVLGLSMNLWTTGFLPGSGYSAHDESNMDCTALERAFQAYSATDKNILMSYAAFYQL